MSRTLPHAGVAALLLLFPAASDADPFPGAWSLLPGPRSLSAQVLLPAGQEPRPVCEDWDEPESVLEASFFYVATAQEVADCIEAGLAVTRPGLGGDYPLHTASAHSADTAVIGVLLRAGADVDARGNRDYAPLHVAALRNPSAFPALLELGADPEAVDDEGRTPMDYAQQNPLLRNLLREP